MITIDLLNISQLQAVQWGDGPLLVLAGPGSGKTMLLTMRVANIIQNSPNENFRVLGLTFTVKAANEMQDRIAQYLGENTHRVQIRTFHSFCTDLLRQHGSHLGLKPDFAVITDDKDRMAILNDVITRMELQGHDISDPEQLLQQIDIMFNHAISLSDLPRYFDNEDLDETPLLGTAFDAYLEALKADNQLDFPSMLYFARKLLETKSRIARQIQTVYRYICVDEFQDTNIAQYEILRLLAGTKQSNLFVVADEDQVIFQWNGADPKRLEALKNDYQPMVIQLPDNYRCPQQIVEIANRLIAHNTIRSMNKKPSKSLSNSAGIVELKSYRTFDEEISGLAGILGRIPERQRENCLVIARNNKLLGTVQCGLSEIDIKAEIVTKKQEFSSPLMRIMYGCLKLANSPESRNQLNKLCSAASDLNVISFSAEEIAGKAKVEASTYLRTFLNAVDRVKELECVSRSGLANLCDSLQFRSFISESLRSFDSLSGNDAFPDYESEKDIWEDLFKRAENEHRDMLPLHVLLQEIDLAPKSKSLTRDCVRLQTVHTAKGIEYKYVYIIGLAEDYFPAFQAKKQGDKSRSMEEERRNCFVAITRTSQSLYLSYARQYFGWTKEPSRFLKEMGVLPCG
jgi:DNA helicase-2/ATP-dependent DNA helicase PcrA